MKRASLTPLALGLAWLLSLGFVFTLGILSAFSFHLKPGTGQTAGLSAPEREAGAVFEQFTGEALDWSRVRSFNPSDRVPPQFLTFVEALSGAESADERQVLARRFFRLFPPAKLQGVLEAVLRPPPESLARQAVAAAAWQAWQEQDPIGAKTFRDALAATGDPALDPFFAALARP